MRGGSRAIVAGAAIVLIAILASLPFSLRTTRALADRLPADVERDYTAFGASVPAGAKIAARWGATDAYVFFAPQGRYLNVLDPVFMAAPHPDSYAAQRRLFEGLDPDIPRTAKQDLDSDYLAFPKWEATPQFTARITHDPRLVRVYDGYNVLLRIQPSNAFITDWNGHSPTADFVKAPATQCTTFTRTLVPGRYELAPWGPTRVWLDGRAMGETRTAPLAILGRGRIIEVGSAAEMKIETCGAGGRTGFYLVQR